MKNFRAKDGMTGRPKTNERLAEDVIQRLDAVAYLTLW